MRSLLKRMGPRRALVIARALVPATLLLPQLAAATPATRNVEVQFKGAGQVNVTVRGSDVEYVELIRHVFDANKSAEVATSEAQYLVAPSLDSAGIESAVLPRAETEDTLNEIPVALPLALSLGAGEY